MCADLFQDEEKDGSLFNGGMARVNKRLQRAGAMHQAMPGCSRLILKSHFLQNGSRAKSAQALCFVLGITATDSRTTTHAKFTSIEDIFDKASSMDEMEIDDRLQTISEEDDTGYASESV